MLRGGSPAPDGTLALDEDTTAVEDVNLLVVGSGLEVVVGNPVPGVLEVDGALVGDVEHHERAEAVLGDGVGGVGVLGALLELELSAGVTTDTGVDIPESGVTLLGTLEVPLHHDSTGLRASGTEDEIRHLNGTSVTGLTDLEDRLGVLLVLEELVTASEDHRPDLTSDANVLGNLDSLGDEVSTVVKVDNLVLGSLVEDGLDGVTVISLAIALGTGRLDADEGAGGNVLILRLGAGEDLASGGIKENVGLLDAALGLLNRLTSAAGLARVLTTLSEEADGLAALEDSSPGGIVEDGLLAAGHVDVVKDESAVGLGGLGVISGLDTDRGVAELAVEDEDGSNSLASGATVGHVDTDLAVVDLDVLEGPGPVPVHEDGSLAVVEGKVASGELLVTEEGTILATVEGQVAHETAGTVVHEDTLLSVLGATILAHVEDDVLQARRLGNLPVETGAPVDGHLGEVDDEVANLTEEVVLVNPPVVTVVLVGVGIDDSHALEAGSGLDRGRADGIANKLSVVKLDNGLADDVGTGREVD